MNLSIRYSLVAPESLLSLYILTVVIPTLLDLTRFFWSGQFMSTQYLITVGHSLQF